MNIKENCSKTDDKHPEHPELVIQLGQPYPGWEVHFAPYPFPDSDQKQ